MCFGQNELLMLKETFQFSLNITIGHSPEFSLNVFNRCQSENENALVTLGWGFFGAMATIWTNIEEYQ